MKLDFDRPFNRTATGSVKYDGLKEYFNNPDLIPMWVADMDFEAPQCVIDAIKRRTDHGIFGYTLVGRPFYDAIINWMKVKHGWEVSADWILFSPGIVPALSMSVMALTSPGDKVLLQSPVYPPFFSSISDNKRILVNNQLRESDGRYSIDFDDLNLKLSNGVKMMFFCNPHNPVGRVWSIHEVRQVVALCRKHNVILISDEIHSDLVYQGYTHIPSAQTDEGAENMVVCMAPSKTFNLAGMASAFLVIPDPELREKMKNMLENLHVHHGNIFGLVALQAAYEGGSEWLKELIEYLSGNIETVCDFFREELPEIHPLAPEGTYLVWLDCRKTGLKDSELKRFFTEHAGIAMNPGTVFGPGGNGFHRMNIGCTRKTIIDALERIKKAWLSIKK